MPKPKLLSIVIPVYNDEEVLEELHRRLRSVLPGIANAYEVIYIDDGSTDGSFDILIHTQAGDDNVAIVKQARNFGQHNSIAAGIRAARGDVIVLMDSDLQDRPEDIHRLLEALETSGKMMAIAQWMSRDDSVVKKLLSNWFFKISARITNLKHSPQLGVFRAIRRQAIEEVKDIPETTGTVLSLLYWSGLSYVTVPLDRDARFAGSSGYNLKKMLALSADRVFSYSLLPIKIATYFGVGIGIFSAGLGAFLIIRRFVLEDIVPGWTSIIVLVLFLFGVNFVFMGVVGEYLGRIYLESKGRPKYITEEVIRSRSPSGTEE